MDTFFYFMFYYLFDIDNFLLTTIKSKTRINNNKYEQIILEKINLLN
jgi:hypothetical protein